MEINDIKKYLPILTVLSHYNIKPDRHNQLRCPFHEDDKPSMKIYPETNTFHCFGCGKTGDVIDFIMLKEGITKHRAILKAKELITGITEAAKHIETIKPTTMHKSASSRTRPFSELFPFFLESIERSDNAKRYCESRGLDYKSLQIGYNSGKLYNKLKNCIIFSLKDKENNTVSLYGRNISSAGKHYYSENRSGLYPHYPNPNTEVLILTEAIIDAATLLQTREITQPGGVTPSGAEVLSCYGNLAFTKEMQTAVKELSNLKEVIIFFDGDKGGLDGIKHVSETLQQIKPGIKITSVDTPEGEDINSLFVKYGKECLIQLINERKPVKLSFSTEPACAEASAGREKNSTIPDEDTLREILSEAEKQYFENLGKLDTTDENKIIFEAQTARYIVKGGLCKQLDKMLISLDVQHLETGIKYRCRLDLYEEKQTRKEAREAAEKLELRSDLIENDLSELCDLLEEHRENQLKVQGSKFNVMEEEIAVAEKNKCLDFLKSPGLVNRINELIGKSGITGEENNRMFLFIIATSHKMPDTLHALIQGSSGSGKTHLLSKIAELMPPERVVKFTRVTENSFYNYDEFFFRNKLICLEDIDGLKEEALFAWRELISNNQLSSSTSQKDENGNIRSAQRIVRGPMASICATTHGHIYEDNMSRLFIIAVDESKQQTERIMQYQSLSASGTIDRDEEERTKEFLQNCVRMLKPCKVVNPYANKIKLPPQAHKIRRLHELFLAFVNQVTILNQYQRKRDNQNRLIAQPEDLKTAVKIMFESIFLKVDELDGSLRQFFESLKNYLEEKPNPQQYEFTQREIRHALNISKTQLHRYMNELIELEYLQQIGGYANKGFKYRVCYWDNIQKLRNEIQSYLFNQIKDLASQTYGTLNGTLQPAPVH